MAALNLMLTMLTALTTVVSMRMVGVLLVSAMIVIPTLTGFAVARSFRQATAIAIAAAFVSVTVGLIAAYYLRLAAGGSVVLTALLIFGGDRRWPVARRRAGARSWHDGPCRCGQPRWRGALWPRDPRPGGQPRPSTASAHPHVFVEHAITVIVGADGLEGLQFAWTFDEMFSSMIVLTFDADKDKTFSARRGQDRSSRSTSPT